jgi:hypothetical protein
VRRHHWRIFGRVLFSVLYILKGSLWTYYNKRIGKSRSTVQFQPDDYFYKSNFIGTQTCPLVCGFFWAINSGVAGPAQKMFIIVVGRLLTQTPKARNFHCILFRTARILSVLHIKVLSKSLFENSGFLLENHNFRLNMDDWLY